MRIQLKIGITPPHPHPLNPADSPLNPVLNIVYSTCLRFSRALNPASYLSARRRGAVQQP